MVAEQIKEMVLLLLSYFDENEDAMFSHVEDTCLAEEMQVNQVCLTPTIVYFLIFPQSFVHPLYYFIFLHCLFKHSFYFDRIFVATVHFS